MNIYPHRFPLLQLVNPLIFRRLLDAASGLIDRPGVGYLKPESPD
jgi:hypothetical protein